MNKEKILSGINFADFYKNHLEKFHINGNNQGKGCCPFHQDINPSLSVNLETGQYFCHGCEDGGDLLKFYMRIKNISFKDALTELSKYSGKENKTSEIESIYKYTDEAGKVLFEVVRYIPKTFRQRRPDGKGGHIYNMDGVSLVPYNLPKVIASDIIYICEGEKDCDNLARLGLIATTNSQGAGKWRDEFGQYFTGKDVIVLCDNDEVGKKHGNDVAQKLSKYAKTIKVIEQLPGVPEKGDISDWLKLNPDTPENQKAKLLELVKNASQWIPKECNETTGFDMTKALKIGAELQTLDIPVKWAVKGLIPKEAITLLSARGGMGKTILSISVADAVTKGMAFLGLETTKMQVVYIDFENSLPTLIERIKRIDASNVLFWHPTNEIKPPRLDSKEYELYKKLPDGALLVFDTLRASQSRDENDSQHMAMIMQRLKELRDCGYTILILHHTSKSSDRIYKGSTAIFDLCDHNLSLHKVKKGCYTPEENESDDDTDNYCYRLGTQDKTRYEPFHIFLEFDTERGCFVIAPDPETETLEEIHSLLVGKEPLKTNDIFEFVKSEIGIKSKGKLTYLLRKGISKYWNFESKGKGKPTYYKATSPAVPLYIPRPLDYPATTSPDKKDQLPQKGLESPDFTDQSSSPTHTQTSWTSQEVTSPDHLEKPRPVQTTSDDTKLVETTDKNVSNEPINLDALGVEL